MMDNVEAAPLVTSRWCYISVLQSENENDALLVQYEEFVVIEECLLLFSSTELNLTCQSETMRL